MIVPTSSTFRTVGRTLLPPPRRSCFHRRQLASQLVCFLLNAGLRKNCSNDCHKIRWKDDTWPRKKPLDFGGNPGHVTLRLELDYGYGQIGVSDTPRHWVGFTRRCVCLKVKFAGSAALGKVRALLSLLSATLVSCVMLLRLYKTGNTVRQAYRYIQADHQQCLASKLTNCAL